MIQSCPGATVRTWEPASLDSRHCVSGYTGRGTAFSVEVPDVTPEPGRHTEVVVATPSTTPRIGGGQRLARSHVKWGYRPYGGGVFGMLTVVYMISVTLWARMGRRATAARRPGGGRVTPY